MARFLKGLGNDDLAPRLRLKDVRDNGFSSSEYRMSDSQNKVDPIPLFQWGKISRTRIPRACRKEWIVGTIPDRSRMSTPFPALSSRRRGTSSLTLRFRYWHS